MYSIKDQDVHLFQMMLCLLSYTLALPPYMIPESTYGNPDQTNKDPATDTIHVEDTTCSPLYSNTFWRYQTRHKRKCGSRDSYCFCNSFVRKNMMLMRFLRRM